MVIVMFRFLAERYDNYIAKKFEKALVARSHTTTSEEMKKLNELLSKQNDEIFLKHICLPIQEIRANFQEISFSDKHRVYQFSFTSPLLTDDEVNNQVFGKFYQSKVNPNAPTLLVIPAWMTYREDKYYTEPLGKMLLNAGINYIFYHLPYHLKRRPEGYLSGELAVSGNLWRTVNFVRQAIIELRTIINWLKDEIRPRKIGVLGISLGGLIGAHLLHLEDQIDFGILMIPAIDPPAIICHTRIGKPMFQDIRKMGMNEEEYRRIFTPFDPASYTPLIDSEKILIIQSKYDQCVPVSSLDLFTKSWGSPPKLICREGHFSIFHTKRPIKEMIKFITNQI